MTVGMDLGDLRLEYDVGSIEPSMMLENPIEQWRTWFVEASDADVFEPNAMVLATVDSGGWCHRS